MNANYGIYRLKYRYGQYLPLTSPVDVSLELASKCNMRCGYCYHGDAEHLPFERGMMKLRTAREIIRQAAELGVNSLKFNWKGESTLNPHFSKITAYAKRLASHRTFIDRLSNSNFKFPTIRDDIFDGLCNQTKVKVSLDSFRKEVFEKQRAGGVWHLTMANIEKFYHYPNRTNTELVIQAVRTTLNADEDIAGEAKKRWPSATISIRDMVSGRLEKDVSALEHKIRNPLESRKSCLQAHVRVIFNWRGKAFVCCPDISEKLCMGDIKKDSLYDIFNSDKVKALRKDLKSKRAFESEPCKGCSSFETYVGYKPNWAS